jgi:Transposase IS116/IS110/IS902 family/Transposase
MRRDLRELRLVGDVIAELRLLTAHRADVAADRTRAINRLRGQLLGIFPALERAMDFTNHGPLVLISQFQTPAALAAAGPEHLERWLREHRVRNAGKLAATALDAARAQQLSLPGEATAAGLIARLATTVLRLDDELHELDEMISYRFGLHRHAETVTSIVGIGVLLGAEFLAATCGGLEGFESADHLAGYAGLAPAPRDSGRRTGNLHRPQDS